MLCRPRFRPHFHVEVVPGEGVFLVTEAKQTLLRGRAYELVSPLLDGRTADELCDHLEGKAGPAEIYYVLNQLERKGYLCEEETSLPDGQAALWSSLHVTPAIVARQLDSHPVRLRSFGIDTAALAESLQALGVRVSADASLPEVVLTDSYLREELRACNQESLRLDRPWLLVKPFGRQVWIGPLFRPGVTGCWECLAHRLRSNVPVLTYLETKRHKESRSFHPIVQDRGFSSATLQIAWGLVAQAVASWLVCETSPELEGKVQTLDVPAWRLQSHALVRLPFCPVCGDSTAPRPDETQPGPALALESRKKMFTNDGGHRVIPPEETIQRFNHHVSPITGAIPALERATPPDSKVLHVYVAGNNVARPQQELAQLRQNLRSMNAGKGMSDVQARASGLCEGLERYSGVFRGNEPRRRARMAELGSSAISLDECLLFSELQYREREARNAEGSHFNFIPLPFDKEASIEWSPVWSLTRRETRYLPTAFCYYAYPHDEKQAFCMACSNGCAAGNTLEEAILQGFLELVERDSVALWWYNRVHCPAVDMDSFGEPYLAQLQEFLHQHQREYWAIDLTSDLGIPVFAAICRRIEPVERIVMGFGAHLESRVALLRAVTEMNQMLSSPLLEPQAGGKPSGDSMARPAQRVGERPHAKMTSQPNGSVKAASPIHEMDPETARWLEGATVANQPYLLPAEGPPRKASTYPTIWTDDVREDVLACQAIVERTGLEMLVLDQTRAEIGLPVAKVIVPGLRHFWARYAPGRLYDVPVKLGWLPRQLAEEELNPIAMFL